MPGGFLLHPVKALKLATDAVPAVRYAVGLVGIAAAIALLRGFLPDVGIVGMLPILGGTIVAMALLVILAAAVAAPGNTSIAQTFLWATCIFVITFMFFTVTAVAFGWPPAWARLILPQSAITRPLFPGDGEADPVVDNTSDASNTTDGNAVGSDVVVDEAAIDNSTDGNTASDPGLVIHAQAGEPTVYLKPSGKIEKVGDVWVESDPSTGVEFRFDEVSRKDGETLVLDQGRGVYMRWPTNGGLVRWSRTNPMNWTDLYYVKPASSTAE